VFVSAVTEKTPYNAEWYLPRAPLTTLPSNGVERIPRDVLVAGSTQHMDWTSARNFSDRYMHGNGSTISYGRPNSNCATSILPTESSQVHTVPRHSSTLPCYHEHRAGATVTSRSVTPRSRPVVAAASRLSRSHTSDAHLCSSLQITYPRPLPPESASVKPSSRRTCPHTAYRM